MRERVYLEREGDFSREIKLALVAVVSDSLGAGRELVIVFFFLITSAAIGAAAVIFGEIIIFFLIFFIFLEFFFRKYLSSAQSVDYRIPPCIN